MRGVGFHNTRNGIWSKRNHTNQLEYGQSKAVVANLPEIFACWTSAYLS